MEKKLINKIIGIILIILGTLRTLLFSVLILFTFDAPEASRITFERSIFILYLGIGSLAILSAGTLLLINRKSGRIILLTTAVSLTLISLFAGFINIVYKELIFYILLILILFWNFKSRKNLKNS